MPLFHSFLNSPCTSFSLGHFFLKREKSSLNLIASAHGNGLCKMDGLDIKAATLCQEMTSERSSSLGTANEITCFTVSQLAQAR